MLYRIIKLTLLALLLVVGCQPPTELDYDSLGGTISHENGSNPGIIKVFSSPTGYGPNYEYSVDYNHIYASTFTDDEGKYTLIDGFPVELYLEFSFFGCSDDDGQVSSVSNQTFVLSFIDSESDTFSVLVIDTSLYGRYHFPEADTNYIDQILMGNNDIFGEPGGLRTIPPITFN